MGIGATLNSVMYLDGTLVLVGDRVQLWEGCTGVVVCSIDDGQFTPRYSREDWEYLQRGVMIETEAYGLFHHTEPDEDFELSAD